MKLRNMTEHIRQSVRPSCCVGLSEVEYKIGRHMLYFKQESAPSQVGNALAHSKPKCVYHPHIRSYVGMLQPHFSGLLRSQPHDYYRMLRSRPPPPAKRLPPPENRPAFSSFAMGGSPNTLQNRSVSSAPACTRQPVNRLLHARGKPPPQFC